MSGGGGKSKKLITNLLTKNIKNINKIVLSVIAVCVFSLLFFGVSKTSYALFASKDEGTNSISLTVSTAGKISIRIFAQDNQSEVATLKTHQNIIKFNVKDGYIMDSFSCTTGEATYNKATNVLTINNATQNGTCEINYVEGYRKLYDLILSESLKASNGLAVTKETNSGNPSYYYTGLVNNNNVSFAGLKWKIIRVNESGNIRIIYNDTPMITTFNSDNYNDTKYMYYSEATGPNGIKKINEDWYANNLTKYDSLIAEDNYCEEFKLVENDAYNILGITTIDKQKYTKTLKCHTDGNGKGSLNLKIGLMNIDELMFAGVPMYEVGTDYNHYFNDGQTFWTMSPSGYSARAYVWMLYGGYFNDGRRDISMVETNINNNLVQLKPVINLVHDIKVVSGDGTETNPFIIKNY